MPWPPQLDLRRGDHGAIPRATKHDYADPGSFARLLEAALAVADVDTDDDRAFHAASMRLRVAAVAYAAARPPRAPEAVPSEERRG